MKKESISCCKHLETVVKAMVQNELHSQMEECPAITKQELQDIITNAILQADDKRIQMNKDRVKNTKVSKGSIAIIIILGICSAFLLALAIVNLFSVNDLQMNIHNSSKFFLISLIYALVAFSKYAVDKNKDSSYGFNVLSVLLTVITLIISLL